MCAKFHANPTFLINRQLWRHGGHLGKFYENGSSVEPLGTSRICTYILSFVKVRLFLRKLEGRNSHFTYTVWSQSGHFECRRPPIFKWAHIYKVSRSQKYPMPYHFWLRSSPGKLSTKNQMTQNQFVHLEDHMYQISCKSDLFEKSPIMTSILEILRK